MPRVDPADPNDEDVYGDDIYGVPIKGGGRG